MATIEEERAKVKGISVPLPAAQTIGAGIRQGMGNIITGANETVRNTSPVRDIYNLAEGVSGFFKGAAGSPAPASVAPAVATQEAPREYVPNPSSPIAPAPIPGNAERSIRNTQAWLAVNKPGYAPGGPAPQAAAPAPDAGIRREMINGNVATSYGGGIPPKTTVQPGYAPQLKTPFTSPKAFATITGYRGDNPIYSSGAAEMAAANAGIAEYNKAAVDKFGAENTLYSTVTGGVPLQQAQALLAGTSAAEMPGENKSQQGFRSAQSKEALANASLLSAKAAVAGDPEPPKPHFGEIETVGPGGITKTPYVGVLDREGNYQVKTPKDSFAAAAESLTPEQKSIAAKHMKKGQTQEEQTSIFTKVKNGELK